MHAYVRAYVCACAFARQCVHLFLLTYVFFCVRFSSKPLANNLSFWFRLSSNLLFLFLFKMIFASQRSSIHTHPIYPFFSDLSSHPFCTVLVFSPWLAFTPPTSRSRFFSLPTGCFGPPFNTPISPVLFSPYDRIVTVTTTGKMTAGIEGIGAPTVRPSPLNAVVFCFFFLARGVFFSVFFFFVGFV